MSRDLEIWQQRVENFAKLGATNRTIRREIEKSKLAGRETLPTSGPDPITSTTPITLAEVRLKKSIPLDVTVSIENLQAVDAGHAGVLVTWGSEQGSVHTAEIDIGRGWNYPFTASYLRIDLVPKRNNRDIPGNQAADVVIVATIAPSAGGALTKLQCTREWGLTVAAGATEVVNIPPWAIDFRLLLNSSTVDVTIFQVGAFPAVIWRQTFVGAEAFRANLEHYPVRLDSSQLAIVNNGVGILTVPAVVFGLNI